MSNGSVQTSETSYPKNKIKILLLENIHAAAVEMFRKQQFQVFMKTNDDLKN